VESPTNPEVRVAEEDEHEAAAEALALAFVDDPAWVHLLPDERSRAERLLAFFGAEIANLVPEWRRIWVTEDGSGAAIWAPPGRWRVPFSRTLRASKQMAKVFGTRLPVATWTLLRIESRHPASPEHWYLHYLGVEPRRQGRGLGGALLAPVLLACDREAVPARLEASTERSRMLYQRHGFDLTDSIDLPLGGPQVRGMWRRPQGLDPGADICPHAGHGYGPAQTRRA
jgi:GNAT superfamily N-acetyltransferase